MNNAELRAIHDADQVAMDLKSSCGRHKERTVKLITSNSDIGEDKFDYISLLSPEAQKSLAEHLERQRCPIHATMHDGVCPKCEAKKRHRIAQHETFLQKSPEGENNL